MLEHSAPSLGNEAGPAAWCYPGGLKAVTVKGDRLWHVSWALLPVWNVDVTGRAPGVTLCARGTGRGQGGAGLRVTALMSTPCTVSVSSSLGKR